MSESYGTRDDALAAIYAEVMTDATMLADGVTIRSCRGSDVCGLVEPRDDQQQACERCEVIIIPPARMA